jgi:undecaprenyl-diphosphatase
VTVSTEWYRDIVEFAADSPAVVQTGMAHLARLGLVVLAALMLLAWCRARNVVPALLGLLGVALSYGVAAGAKSALAAERPCHTVSDLAIVATECPPAGDWSFPSSSATIAGACFAAILLSSRRTGLLVLPFAALVALSRVFVGVHYPHDVAVGFLLGAGVTAATVTLLARPAAALAGRRPAGDRQRR